MFSVILLIISRRAFFFPFLTNTMEADAQRMDNIELSVCAKIALIRSVGYNALFGGGSDWKRCM
jgi:hypothetical protein